MIATRHVHSVGIEVHNDGTVVVSDVRTDDGSLVTSLLHPGDTATVVSGQSVERIYYVDIDDHPHQVQVCAT